MSYGFILNFNLSSTNEKKTFKTKICNRGLFWIWIQAYLVLKQKTKEPTIDVCGEFIVIVKQFVIIPMFSHESHYYSRHIM